MTWSIVLWAMGVFGIGGVIMLAFAFPAITSLVFAFLRTRIGKIVAGIGFILALIVGAGVYGKAKGRAEERAKLKALTEKEVGVSAKEVARINALSDEEVDKELAKWDRK